MLLKIVSFYGGELSAPRSTPIFEHHPFSAVREDIFNLFAATLHIGGRYSIRNLRTRYAVVAGTHLSRWGFIQGHHFITVVLHTGSSFYHGGASYRAIILSRWDFIQGHHFITVVLHSGSSFYHGGTSYRAIILSRWGFIQGHHFITSRLHTGPSFYLTTSVITILRMLRVKTQLRSPLFQSAKSRGPRPLFACIAVNIALLLAIFKVTVLRIILPLACIRHDYETRPLQYSYPCITNTLINNSSKRTSTQEHTFKQNPSRLRLCYDHLQIILGEFSTDKHV